MEIDPAVIDIAKEYFALGQQPVNIAINDGRVFLRGSRAKFDFIAIDAYTNEYYIPWHLVTKEFFDDVAKHLTADGIVAFNVGSTSATSPLLRSFEATLQSVFTNVYLVPVPGSLNNVVLASDRTLDPVVLKVIKDERAPLVQQWQLNWQEAKVASAVPILTDNRAPVELYTERMVWEYLWGIRL